VGDRKNKKGRGGGGIEGKVPIVKKKKKGEREGQIRWDGGDNGDTTAKSGRKSATGLADDGGAPNTPR